MSLTVERLREVVHYNPGTGFFTWLISRRVVRAGARAGSVHKKTQYLRIKIDGVDHLAHRLAWLYMTGQWPPDQIDHRDLVRSHNWWSNLRLANNSQNNANSRLPSCSTSGFKGVTWSRHRKKWQAQITFQGRNQYLGGFDTPEAAHAAYAAAAIKHHGEFARLA